MLLNRFILVSAVLGLAIILLTLRAVRRGWSRESQRVRRRLESGRILRRAERVPARVTQQVMGNAASADLPVAVVLTESELHVFRHVDGDLARPANGAPFHVLLTPQARAAARPDRRGLRLALADAPLRDGAAVELRMAGGTALSWRLTFADEGDASEWLALIDRIASRAPEIRDR
jgi:hypothetical protein